MYCISVDGFRYVQWFFKLNVLSPFFPSSGLVICCLVVTFYLFGSGVSDIPSRFLAPPPPLPFMIIHLIMGPLLSVMLSRKSWIWCQNY